MIKNFIWMKLVKYTMKYSDLSGEIIENQFVNFILQVGLLVSIIIIFILECSIGKCKNIYREK